MAPASGLNQSAADLQIAPLLANVVQEPGDFGCSGPVLFRSCGGLAPAP
jgi:hypothetical protein